MTKYLVTGGTGFVGANLVHRLVRENKEVFVLSEENCDTWRLNKILSSCIVHKISLTQFEQINSLIKDIKPDIIFHLAAYGGMPDQKDQKEILDVNFYGTVNLLNACKSVGFDCFINTGSSSEYGIKNSVMDEDDVLHPVSDYGVSKAASTQFCLKVALFNKLPVYTVRPFSVYGDFEMQGRLIPSILINALNNRTINLSSPNFVRDFIYIQDVVDLYIKLCETKPTQNYIFNAGTGVQSSIKDVINTAQTLFNHSLNVVWGESEPRPWEPKRWQASMQNARQFLNWEAKYTLNSGLKKSLEWFEKNNYLYERKNYEASCKTKFVNSSQ